MNIYNFMNQKMVAKINREDTGMIFPGITLVKAYWRKSGHYDTGKK